MYCFCLAPPHDLGNWFEHLPKIIKYAHQNSLSSPSQSPSPQSPSSFQGLALVYLVCMGFWVFGFFKYSAIVGNLVKEIGSIFCSEDDEIQNHPDIFHGLVPATWDNHGECTIFGA